MTAASSVLEHSILNVVDSVCLKLKKLLQFSRWKGWINYSSILSYFASFHSVQNRYFSYWAARSAVIVDMKNKHFKLTIKNGNAFMVKRFMNFISKCLSFQWNEFLYGNSIPFSKWPLPNRHTNREKKYMHLC